MSEHHQVESDTGPLARNDLLLEYVESSPQPLALGVFRKETQTLELYPNRAFCGLFQLSGEGVYPLDAILEQSSELVVERLNDTDMREGMQVLLVEVITPSAMVAVIQARVFQVTTKEIFLSVSAVDITKQRELELVLQRTIESWHALLFHSPVPIVLYEEQRPGRFILANRAAREMLGIGNNASITKFSIAKFALEEDVELVWRPRGRAFEALEVGDRLELARARLQTVDGRIIDVMTVVSKVQMYDAFGRLITAAQNVIVDLSPIVALEREISARKTAELFADYVAHDLKNPITSILMQIALAIAKPEQADHYLEVIRLETERLGRIVEDLLLLARIGGGRVEPRFALSDVVDLVQCCVRTHDAAAQAKHQQVEIVTGGRVHAVLDRGLMLRVLDNIVRNAIVYTPDGGSIVISISADIEKNELNIAIRDNGPGIAASEQNRLFDRFYRGEASAEVPGTGLGLAIARDITWLHCGKIEVESQLGAGTTFTVVVPLSR